MAKFTVEVTYLLPVYRQVTVEADSADKACISALSDEGDDWKQDYDSARANYVTGIWRGKDAAYRGKEVRIPDEYRQERT